MNEMKILEKIQDIVLNIDPNEVLKDARSAGLDVYSTKDFIDHPHKYVFIEKLMKKYANSTAMYSATTGFGSGFGGFGTMVTLGGIDLGNMAAQLYRLNQKLAILNGFDLEDSLQQDKAWSIYLVALGFDATAQALIKQQLLNATKIAGKRGAKSNIVLKLIMEVIKRLGLKEVNTKVAAKFIPVFGAVAGGGLSYAFANAASKKMIAAYKTDYFDRWQATQ